MFGHGDDDNDDKEFSLSCSFVAMMRASRAVRAYQGLSELPQVPETEAFSDRANQPAVLRAHVRRRSAG